jgi:hypothetical protein
MRGTSNRKGGRHLCDNARTCVELAIEKEVEICDNARTCAELAIEKEVEICVIKHAHAWN